MISIFVIIVGLSFIFAVKMERLQLLRAFDIIRLTRKNIFCFKEIIENKLSSMINVIIAKRGKDGIQNKTLHYILLINFENGNSIEVMESNSLRKVKQKV